MFSGEAPPKTSAFLFDMNCFVCHSAVLHTEAQHFIIRVYRPVCLPEIGQVDVAHAVLCGGPVRRTAAGDYKDSLALLHILAQNRAEIIGFRRGAKCRRGLVHHQNNGAVVCRINVSCEACPLRGVCCGNAALCRRKHCHAHAAPVQETIAPVPCQRIHLVCRLQIVFCVPM